MPERDDAYLITGRWIYSIGVIAIAVQQLFYRDFRPVILPSWPVTGQAFWSAFTSALMIIAAAGVIFGKKRRRAALLLGGLFFILFFFGHGLYEFLIDPNSKWHLGLWTNPLKELALSGGAFVMAGSFTGPESQPGKKRGLMEYLEIFIPVGSVFFSITMVAFGLDHFYYPSFVQTLVPAWIPGPLFWTYFAGIALMGSGLAIIFRIRLKRVAFLLAVMLFLWVILLHVPRAVADPFGDKGNEWTSVFEALAFCGTALTIAYGFYTRNWRR